MPLRFAVKRLSAVETDPTRSHQHEFHAGELRRELELPENKLAGAFDILILGADGDLPVVEASAFTLYDSRENSPNRSAEWRLYYSSDVVAEAAAEGDLLILYRHADGLRAVIARTGTRGEADLLRALELGDGAVRERIQYLDAPIPDERQSRELVEQLSVADAIVSSGYPATDHPTFRRAIRERNVPTTAEMATAAAEIVGLRGVTMANPDAYLDSALAAETELYFAIEEDLQQARLEELTAARANLAEIMDFSISLQQSRRSRRGQSLQNHLAVLLRDREIPFTAQCQTERGERPDFVVPGCAEYHDMSFPAQHLRMIACKSTAKERWRQVLNEAERIPDKFLVTVDTDLTAPVIEAMTSARLQPFLPMPTIESAYAANPERSRLGSVATLLARLETIAIESHG